VQEDLVMATVANLDRQLAQTPASSIQTYARIAGLLLLLTLIAGGFGEGYVPSKLIVLGDATATAHNIQAFDWLYRMSLAGYLVEALSDIGLSLIFYVLLRPVHKDLALLAAFFGLVGTASYFACELFYLAPSLILGGAGYSKTFTPDQLNTLALLSLKVFAYGGEMTLVLYGVPSVLRGYLIFRSGYLPKFLGVLLTLGGLAFIARSFLQVLAPAYAADYLHLFIAPAMLSLTVWLLVRGVDVRKWEKRAVTSDVRV
jgi:hypothetical protein